MPTTKPAANVSRYSFEPSQLSADTFTVVHFQGTEGISRPFEFNLQLVSENPDVSFSDVVDKPATFTMLRGDEDVPVHGIVTNLKLQGQTADYVSYHATLQPRLTRLELSHRSRIFQEMTVEDILNTVFEEGGVPTSDVQFALQGSYSQRKFCVQYQESDFNFISRLMEREGIYYFFDHSGGSETMVITDKKSEHETMPAPSSLKYHDGAGGMVDKDLETVGQFACREQVVTGKVKMKDYNYRTPETMATESQGGSEMPGKRYEYGPGFRESGRGDRLATVRGEAEKARRRVMSGESDSVGLQSGYLFTLEKHFRDSFNQDYLVTSIKHEGSQRAGLSLDSLPGQDGKEEKPDYRNEFACIPASVQYRPPATAEKPDAPGVVTATVESAGGNYAYIDDKGRYRAKMHFDERSDRSEGTKTLPIRMTQPYSGPDYGMHFPNHADTELIVAFENGDIDRPIALGTAPNPSNTSPSVSGNKMENILRTWGGNELIMDDTEEETQVKLNSSNEHKLLFDDKNKKIEILSTDQHKVLLDDDNKRIEIQSKEGRKILLDDDNKAMSVVSKTGHFIDVCDENDVITVSDADEAHVLTLDYGNEKMSIVTEGDIGFEAEGAIEMQSESLSIETNQGAEMTVGGDLTQSADGSVTVEAGSSGTIETAQALDLAAGTSATLEASTNLTAEGGANTELKGGANLKLEGSTIAEVKGGMLKANG